MKTTKGKSYYNEYVACFDELKKLDNDGSDRSDFILHEMDKMWFLLTEDERERLQDYVVKCLGS